MQAEIFGFKPKRDEDLKICRLTQAGVSGQGRSLRCKEEGIVVEVHLCGSKYPLQERKQIVICIGFIDEQYIACIVAFKAEYFVVFGGKIKNIEV